MGATWISSEDEPAGVRSKVPLNTQASAISTLMGLAACMKASQSPLSQGGAVTTRVVSRAIFAPTRVATSSDGEFSAGALWIDVTISGELSWYAMPFHFR